jgi:hypothetical protein
MPHLRGEPFGFRGLGAGRGLALLRGPWTGGHHHNAQGFWGHPPSTLRYGDRTSAAVPPPAAWPRVLGATRFLHPQRHGGLVRSPPFPVLPHGTSAGHQGHQADPFFSAPPSGPLTIALTLSHKALDSRTPQRAACLHGEWGCEALTRVAIADAHAQGQAAVAPHPQTQQNLRQLIAALLTMAIRGARWPRDLLVWGPRRVRRGLPLISPLPGQRRGLLVEPGKGDGV